MERSGNTSAESSRKEHGKRTGSSLRNMPPQDVAMAIGLSGFYKGFGQMQQGMTGPWAVTARLCAAQYLLQGSNSRQGALLGDFPKAPL